MDFKSGRQKFILLVLPDSKGIAQKSILFVTSDVLDDRHNVHTGSCSRAGVIHAKSTNVGRGHLTDFIKNWRVGWYKSTPFSNSETV